MPAPGPAWLSKPRRQYRGPVLRVVRCAHRWCPSQYLGSIVFQPMEPETDITVRWVHASFSGPVDELGAVIAGWQPSGRKSAVAAAGARTPGGEGHLWWAAHGRTAWRRRRVGVRATRARGGSRRRRLQTTPWRSRRYPRSSGSGVASDRAERRRSRPATGREAAGSRSGPAVAP